jgi:hypothetical protein
MIFSVVHFLCNYITYVKFNTNVLHNAFYLLINALKCFGLNVGHLQGARKFFLSCAVYASTCIIGILHIIKIIIIIIIIIMIKRYIS